LLFALGISAALGMNTRNLRITVGMVVAPLVLAAIWIFPYRDNPAFNNMVVINTVLAYATFTILAAISHAILRFLRFHSAWQYCLVMFGVAFVVYAVLAFISVNGYQELYYSQTQVVKDGSLTHAGVLLQIKDSFKGAAILSIVFLVFWFVAVRQSVKAS
jgi:hypothetical protein